MSARAWRRADKEDLPALTAFLASREERCAGFTGRLAKEGALRLPPLLRGSVWIARDPASAGDVAGALLCHPSRLAFPVLPPDPAADGGLALAAGSWRPASAIGLASDLARYEAAFRLEAKAAVGYRLMSRPPAAPAMGAAPPAPRGAVVRRAAPSDLEALLPLQEAYEREEVLTPIHAFNAAACRASLARSLERQIVILAEEGGTVTAKAGTNARGLAVDQVGGVYTLPGRRGRGLATALVAFLLSLIEGEGRRASLFVKPGNAPALSLYRALGFVEIDDFRASYYEA